MIARLISLCPHTSNLQGPIATAPREVLRPAPVAQGRATQTRLSTQSPFSSTAAAAATAPAASAAAPAGSGRAAADSDTGEEARQKAITSGCQVRD